MKHLREFQGLGIAALGTMLENYHFLSGESHNLPQVENNNSLNMI